LESLGFELFFSDALECGLVTLEQGLIIVDLAGAKKTLAWTHLTLREML
jgi:hypothetical protein